MRQTSVNIKVNVLFLKFRLLVIWLEEMLSHNVDWSVWSPKGALSNIYVMYVKADS